jgi:hypothetical protein
MTSRIELLKQLVRAVESKSAALGKVQLPSQTENRLMDELFKELHHSDFFERLYKLMHTSHVSVSGFRPSNFSYVDLEPPKVDETFFDIFENQFVPRLQGRRDRSEGFRTIFRELSKRTAPPLIIETGCMRVAGNWDGDGQSSFMFDVYTTMTAGQFITIDINTQSADTARKACSSNTIVILNDSISTLSNLSNLLFGRCIDLIYLDSFDVNPNEPMASAIHHSMELTAAAKIIGSGSMVCVDDYRIDGVIGGKGLLIDQYMSAINAEVIFDGYQKAWRLR